MPLPIFLIIGAPRCGTTALYRALMQHPQIFMSPEKEPHFFAFEGEVIKWNGPRASNIDRYWRTRTTSLKEYEKLFDKAGTAKALGEASPCYMTVPRACQRIRYYIPRAKLIAILRNPVDRAYSHFCHCVRRGFEPILDFGEALQKEDERTAKDWGLPWYYKQNGLYYKQLKGYYNLFSKKQLRVYLYDDFAADPFSVLRDIFHFLNVDDSFSPNLKIRPNLNTGIPAKCGLSTVMQNIRSHFISFYSLPASMLK
jgi:hypothetical protein